MPYLKLASVLNEGKSKPQAFCLDFNENTCIFPGSGMSSKSLIQELEEVSWFRKLNAMIENFLLSLLGSAEQAI